MEHDGEGVAEVHDDPEAGRFTLEEGGHLAQLVYRAEDGVLELLHTDVPDAIGGRGIGGRLVRAAVERALAGGLTVVPYCPFARRWLEAHPDVAASVPVEWP